MFIYQSINQSIKSSYIEGKNLLTQKWQTHEGCTIEKISTYVNLEIKNMDSTTIN